MSHSRRRTRVWRSVAIVAVAGVAAVAWSATRSKQISTPAAGAPLPASMFTETIANNATPTEAAPPGMVWIPGGEFSMGAQDPPDMNDAVGMQAAKDSRPIHRVYVDGF
jgi:formylglycine-generating enzyme